MGYFSLSGAFASNETFRNLSSYVSYLAQYHPVLAGHLLQTRHSVICPATFPIWPNTILFLQGICFKRPSWFIICCCTSTGHRLYQLRLAFGATELGRTDPVLAVDGGHLLQTRHSVICPATFPIWPNTILFLPSMQGICFKRHSGFIICCCTSTGHRLYQLRLAFGPIPSCSCRAFASSRAFGEVVWTSITDHGSNYRKIRKRPKP